MSLKFSLQNTKLTGMDQDFSDEAWEEFHKGNINTQDDLYDHLMAFIENQVIYTYDNEAILEGNSEYCFEEHELFMRPNNIAQAAFAVVYDYITESPDTVTWNEMEECLSEMNEENNTLQK